MNSTKFEYSNDSDLDSVPRSVEIIRQVCIGVWAHIVLVGIFGNILTVIILKGPKMNTTSTTLYLTVLAIVDILYLVFSLGGQMYDFAFLFPKTMRQTNEIACKLLNIIRYSLTYISVWLLVAVSIDRMIWVMLPFRAKLICTRKTAKIVVFSFCIFFIGIDLHFLWTVQFIKLKLLYNCIIINNTAFKYIFPYVDLTLVMFLPFIIMLISNILIVFKMKKVSRVRQTLHRPSTITEPCQSENVNLKTNSSISSTVNEKGGSCKESSTKTRSLKQSKIFNRRASRSGQKDRQTSSLTRMLLSVNIFFMVSTAPLLVYDIVYYVVDIDKLVHRKGAYLGEIIFGLERLVYTLWYLNFSIHFLLYCLSGPRFREEAKLFINTNIFRGHFLKQLTVKPKKNKTINTNNTCQTSVLPNHVNNENDDNQIPKSLTVYSCIRETQI